MKPIPGRFASVSSVGGVVALLALAWGSVLCPSIAGANELNPEFGLYDLEEGMRVEVRGELRDGKIRASEITLKADDAGRTIDVRSSLDGDWQLGSDPWRVLQSGDLRMLGATVVVESDARLRGAGDWSELLREAKAGRWVKITALEREGVLRASSVALRDQTSGKPEVEGRIEDIRRRSGDRLKVEIGEFEIAVKLTTEFDAEIAVTSRADRDWIGYVDDDDETPRGFRLLADRVELGGQFESLYEPETDFNLDEEVDLDETLGRVGGSIEAAATLRPKLHAYARAAFQRTLGIKEIAGNDLDDTNVTLRQAYLTWGHFFPSLQSSLILRVGRQDFDEKREWLFDENLDAVRMVLKTRPGVNLEAAIMGRLVDDNEDDEHQTYGFAAIHGEIRKKWELWAWGIGRNDPVRGDDARWFGVRSFGRIVRGFEHWADVGWVRGDLASSSGDRTREGEGFDFGALIEPLELMGASGGVARFAPSIAIGYAQGSGDDNETREVDESYRQSPFADNNDTFSGVTSFRYYGEALDPELRNLSVFTFGVGVRVLPETSLDVVYHRYRQDIADDRVRSSDIDCDLDEDLGCLAPEGENDDLGTGLDVILGFEEIRNVELEVVYATFNPGDAFASSASRASRTSVQLRWKF